MKRLMRAMRLDILLQVRTNLYTIGIGAGVLIAGLLGWLVPVGELFNYIPATMLVAVGGSTLLYVAAMILFEKEQGTLNATVVSPMRPTEYLWSKIITLTLLATVEAVVMVGGSMLLMRFFKGDTAVPNIPLLLIGIILIGVIYTLIGILLIVRFDKITEFLIPMSGVAVLLQIPFAYFLGWFEFIPLLAIPTSAPTVLMQGAYESLATWEWVYGVLYTAVLLIGLTIWAHRAFDRHIIQKVG